MNPEINTTASQPGRRAWWALCLTLLATLAALVWVWLTPEETGGHFWWVAQAMPVTYVLLLWWVHGIRNDEPGDP